MRTVERTNPHTVVIGRRYREPTYLLGLAVVVAMLWAYAWCTAVLARNTNYHTQAGLDAPPEPMCAADDPG